MTTRSKSIPSPQALWTVRDVAGYLQASTSYVYKAAERGEIPCRRIGALLRFDPDEVRRWVASHAKPDMARVLPLRSEKSP